MKRLSIPAVFGILIGLFAFLVSFITIPLLQERISFLFIAISATSFFLLGVVLVLITLKQEVKGNLKKFLILTGASAAGFFVSVLLHNFLYGLSEIIRHITLLHYLTEALHVTFFIIAVLVCPLGFLIGTIGSIVLLIRKQKSK